MTRLLGESVVKCRRGKCPPVPEEVEAMDEDIQSKLLHQNHAGKCPKNGCGAFVSVCCNCWSRMNYCTRAVLFGATGIFLALSALAVYIALCTPTWWRSAVDDAAPTDGLRPPNPQVPQPPSPSTMHVFQNAAVCSDSDVCSRVGR
ncbi:hypothetical protein DMENIID0001_015270 [Sergentomyia squamirostris]